MQRLKKIIKKFPILPSLLEGLYKNLQSYRLQKQTTERIFTDIYKNNHWEGKDSISGTGSDSYQTRVIVDALPTIFKKYEISTILDIPCGDFHWIQNMNFEHLHYIGADIVHELVEKNTKQYATANTQFQQLDLIKDKLPQVDLVLCRDCLVHFSYDDIFKALKNICASDSTFLLTTTFTNRSQNENIATGQWRPLNLERGPFHLPAAALILNEECNEDGGIYSDKALGLWEITDIQKSINSLDQ